MEASVVISAAQAGDSAAFQQLCGNYYTSVMRIADSYLRNRHDAEDVAQQVMVRLMEALPRYDPDVESFDGWLFTVVKHQAFDHLRRNARTQPEAPDRIDRRREEAVPIRETVDRWQSDHRLGPVINLLPKRQRHVLLLHYMYDMSGKQIADVLGCSHPCVRQSHHRALAFLAQRLSP
jgi:RNA polymerase sigma-70 factor, ECF subfamily